MLTTWSRAERGLSSCTFLLFTDKPLSLGEGKRVGQRVSAKVARGWACAWSQKVSEECQTPGGVALKTPAPTRIS